MDKSILELESISFQAELLNAQLGTNLNLNQSAASDTWIDLLGDTPVLGRTLFRTQKNLLNLSAKWASYVYHKKDLSKMAISTDDAMLGNRNVAMTQKIKDYLQTGNSYFISVSTNNFYPL